MKEIKIKKAIVEQSLAKTKTNNSFEKKAVRSRAIQNKYSSPRELKRAPSLRLKQVNEQLLVDDKVILANGFEVFDAIAETTGAYSSNASAMIIDAMTTTYSPTDNHKTSEAATNEMLAMLYELDPQDGVEGLLCNQMIACQKWIAKCGNYASNLENSFEVRTMYLDKMTKMMGLFTKQVETLGKYRNKGKQTVTVQHVTVNDGGQAIVGNVNGGRG